MKTFLISVFVHLVPLVSLLCVLCASVVSSPAQDFKTIHDGVEHAVVNHKLGTEPVKMNLLRLDRSKVKLDVVHAGDLAIGTETTSSIAKRRGAIAAINSGFFRLDRTAWAGDANGALMIDGFVLSESFADRTALFITDFPLTLFAFGTIRTESSMEIAGRKFVIDGLYRQRNVDEIIIYDSKFGPKTLTDANGIEISVVGDKVTAINRHKGNSLIPVKGYVISASGKWMNELSKTSPGDEVRVFNRPFLLRDAERYLLNHVDDIVAGVPQLIKNGKIDITWEQEKASKSFVETRHPRTAVAKMKDGKFLMVTVDGRQPGVSVGMSLYELADYLLSIGAQDAMNLDGGGSTTMFLDGKVVNTPSDKEGERKVGDAILVTLRKKK